MPVMWDSVRVTSSMPDCFADEIAIDFPSVNPLVERVRDAFLGERPGIDTLTTEVPVSRRDAALGVVLPLDVPVQGTCDLCGGRGEVWTEPCAACCGTGNALVHHSVRLSVPPGVVDGARFRFRIASMPVEITIRTQHL
jgi:hypothetical protein